MLKQRVAAANEVGPALDAAEYAIDDALLRVTEMAQAIIRGRRIAGLAAKVGQDALEEAAATANTLFIARGQIVRTHDRLSDLRDQIGLRTHAGGNYGDKPDQKIESIADVTSLRALQA